MVVENRLAAARRFLRQHRLGPLEAIVRVYLDRVDAGWSPTRFSVRSKTYVTR